MGTIETAKPAHLGGELERTDSASTFEPQARAHPSALGNRDGSLRPPTNAIPVGGMVCTAPRSVTRPAATANVAFKRYCRECGTAFLAHRHTAEFCATRCRQHFNNRRAERGRDLYDLVMEWRFRRDRAGAAQTLISKLAAQYKLEDERERDGRFSWNGIDDVQARNPHLASEVLDNNIAGLRRRRR
jgi:hypothetical protein